MWSIHDRPFGKLACDAQRDDVAENFTGKRQQCDASSVARSPFFDR